MDESVLAFFSNSILISLGLVLLLHSSSCTFELDRGSIMIASSEKKWSRICCIKNAWSSCNFEIKHEHIILLYNGGMGRVERIESDKNYNIIIFICISTLKVLVLDFVFYKVHQKILWLFLTSISYGLYDLLKPINNG